jgi:hypothetical protein
MKKIFILMVLAILMFITTMPASAVSGKTVVRGEVTSITSDAFMIKSNKGETVQVRPPAGYDLSRLKVGNIVLVKGSLKSDGSLAANSIKIISENGIEDPDENDDQNGDDQGEDENSAGDDSRAIKSASAYCNGEIQGKPHPVAAKLAQLYGVTPEWVMGYFCSGHGMGTIFLALKTSQLAGVNAGELIGQHDAGKGWGEIWQELNLIGKARPGDQDGQGKNKREK